VKKTIAAVGAAALGLGGALVGVAAPATAEVTTPCADATLHEPSPTGTYDTNWYMDCVPQYGVGKVEFTITSETPFPAGFDLSDTAMTTTSSAVTPAAANTYWGTTPPPIGFDFLATPNNADPNTQDYAGAMYFKVSGVAGADETTPPAACTENADSYAYAYTISYADNTVHFSTTVDGVTKQYDVSSSVAPVTLYLNLSPSGNFYPDDPQCATNGSATLYASGNGDPFYDQITLTHASGDLSPFPLAITIDFPIDATFPLPGDLGAFAEAPEPAALPATGPTESGALAGLAAGLVALGASTLMVLGARRRAKGAA
jgi:hypothetical protein